MTTNPPAWARFEPDDFRTGWNGEFDHLTGKIKYSLGFHALEILGRKMDRSALLKSLYRLRDYSRFAIAHLDPGSDERAELLRVRPDYTFELSLTNPGNDPELVASVRFMTQKRKIAVVALIELIESGEEMYPHDFKTAQLFLDNKRLVNEMEVIAAAARFGP